MLCCFSSFHGAWRTQESGLHWLLEGRSERSKSNLSTETKIIIEMSLHRKLTSSYTAWSGITKESVVGNSFLEEDPGKYASSIRPYLGLT